MQFAVVAYGSRYPTFCALAIIWALLTGFSRAVMGRHYICDVLAGLLAGTCTTALVTQVRLITGFCCPEQPWYLQKHTHSHSCVPMQGQFSADSWAISPSATLRLLPAIEAWVPVPMLPAAFKQAL